MLPHPSCARQLSLLPFRAGYDGFDSVLFTCSMRGDRLGSVSHAVPLAFCSLVLLSKVGWALARSRRAVETRAVRASGPGGVLAWADVFRAAIRTRPMGDRWEARADRRCD